MSTFKNESIVQGAAPNFKRDTVDWVVTFVVGILFFLSGLAFGIIGGQCSKEEEAIRVGVAQWVGDKDGKPRFKWREAKP